MFPVTNSSLALPCFLELRWNYFKVFAGHLGQTRSRIRSYALTKCHWVASGNGLLSEIILPSLDTVSGEVRPSRRWGGESLGTERIWRNRREDITTQATWLEESAGRREILFKDNVHINMLADETQSCIEPWRAVECVGSTCLLPF